MKEVGKLKLKQLKKNELERREMNAVKGGCDCKGNCGCPFDLISYATNVQNNYGY